MTYKQCWLNLQQCSWNSCLQKAQWQSDVCIYTLIYVHTQTGMYLCVNIHTEINTSKFLTKIEEMSKFFTAYIIQSLVYSKQNCL